MLYEIALRRSRFHPGPAVRLADGQAWTLPEPTSPGVVGEEYDALLDALGEAADTPERLRSELALAIYLLQCNYRLEPACYMALLDCPAGDVALLRMQRAFREVAESHVAHRRARDARRAESTRPVAAPSPRWSFFRRRDIAHPAN